MIQSLPYCRVAFDARRFRRGVAAIVVAGVCIAVPSLAVALGLGPITQQSGLGQTLRVVVPVTLGEREEVPPQCFRIVPGQGSDDGIPDLLSGRVIAERTPSGTTLVITTPRPVHDPVVRITIRAGCETSVRREYTLFMDPPAIDAPVVTAPEQPSPGDVRGLPPEPSPREARRPPQRSPARTVTGAAQAPVSSADAEAQGKGTPPKARPAPRATPRPPPAAAGDRPRLSVSSGAPGTLPAALATEADRERARQERANAIEAETQVLQKRIVELTAMVERMQQELRARELAEQAAAAQAAKAPAEAVKAPAQGSDAAKAPAAGAPPAAAEASKAAAQDTAPAVEPAKPPAQDAAPAAQAAKLATPTKAEPPAHLSTWWEQNALLIGTIGGLPLAIAAFLLWKRRRDAAHDDRWRTASIPVSKTPSQLRNPSAGLAMPGRTVPPAMNRVMASPAAPRDAVDALAVSDLSHVTEEARVFMALGHNDRAIEVLQDHIRRLPRSMPAAWLMLLDLYHQEGNRTQFHTLADAFHTHFNVRAPVWEEFVGENTLTGGIESFPAISRQVVALWRKAGCRPYLEGLLFNNREGRRNGFPLAAYSDILLLLQVLDAPTEIDIDQDLVAAGKLEGRPQGKSATPRKPMPPDPWPAQQPIRFEIDPPEGSDRNSP